MSIRAVRGLAMMRGRKPWGSSRPLNPSFAQDIPRKKSPVGVKRAKGGVGSGMDLVNAGGRAQGKADTEIMRSTMSSSDPFKS